jgi:VanZ family protein
MRLVKYWLPVVIWSAVILAASGDFFSAEHSGGMLKAMLGDFPPWLHIALRKLSHLAGYGILGVLAFRAARVDLGHPLLVSLLIAVVVAIADETHQSTVPTRTSSAGDVLLDLAGAGLGAALLRARAISAPATPS